MEIRPGSICRADSGGVRRLVYVTALDETIASVFLLTNEVELAGARDYLLPPEITGLPYPLLCESDLVGPVELTQLTPLGQAPPEFLSAAQPAGIPIVFRHDSRWRWKLEELTVLHWLCASAMRAIAD